MAVLTTESPKAQAAYLSLRERVFSTGVGVPFPPVSEISRELNVSQHTINKAYSLLETEGLIKRERRKGVFVADRTATGEIAVVMTQDAMKAEASPVYRMICATLRTVLHELNPQWSVKIHLGVSTVPGPEFPTTLDLRQPDVLPRLRGVFSFHPLYDLESSLEQANVPVVHLGESLFEKYSVSLDTESFLRQSIEHLAQVGCRNICFLWAKYVGDSPGSVTESNVTSIQIVADEAGRHGITSMDKWIPYEEGGYGEQEGYELFMQLWNGLQQPARLLAPAPPRRSGLAARPDAVIVSDDFLCKGVLRAVLHLGVRLPEDLRLITYSNKGVLLPFHEPVTRVEFDLEEQAKRAVSMMETLVSGQKPSEPTVVLVGKLIKGKTT